MPAVLAVVVVAVLHVEWIGAEGSTVAAAVRLTVALTVVAWWWISLLVLVLSEVKDLP